MLNSITLLNAETLDTIVVNSEFRQKTLEQTSNAITVLNEDKLYDNSAQPFIDTISSVPNVNFSAGASKAKYIQIRGIGERSQFETPMNPSVAIIQDGIDLSHSTLALSTFDVNQVEILKGPQGTVFGANAIAGVITVESNKPTEDTEAHIETTIGNYNTKALGAAVGGTIIKDKLLGRFSVYKNTSDGYIKNSYLNRKDTNNIDELISKMQLSWLKSDNHTIDFKIIHTDIDNGYDQFNFDNSRTTISDEPGKDTQVTNAFAIKSTYEFNNAKLISSISTSKTKTEYKYDEDWSYPLYHADAWTGTDQYLRDKKQLDVDIRLQSNQSERLLNNLSDWTVGVYHKNYEDDLTRNHTYNAQYNGKYNTTSNAIYNQIDTHISKDTTIVSGLRIEKIDAKYTDTKNFNTNTNETLVGGKIGINYKRNKDSLYYATLSKGYKPGGVNANGEIQDSQREFSKETLWNIDIGMNESYLDSAVKTRLNIFYGKRIDQQVKSSLLKTDPITNATTFNDYYSNAAKGYNYGVEYAINYTANKNLRTFLNMGLLKAKFSEYTTDSGIDVTGRAPAQSPEYQYNIGFDYLLTSNWSITTDVNGKGSYYFSNRHNEKSESYKLLNASATYIHNELTLTLWAKNITDESYQTKGFGSFGNNPANGWVTELYTQQGSPRTFGVTLGYDF